MIDSFGRFSSGPQAMQVKNKWRWLFSVVPTNIVKKQREWQFNNGKSSLGLCKESRG